MREQFFQAELEKLISRYGFDKDCNCPDFILASMLIKMLNVYKVAVADNFVWHGLAPRDLAIQQELNKLRITGDKRLTWRDFQAFVQRRLKAAGVDPDKIPVYINKINIKGDPYEQKFNEVEIDARLMPESVAISVE